MLDCHESKSTPGAWTHDVILCINSEYPEDTHWRNVIHRAWVHIALPASTIERTNEKPPIYEDTGKRLQKALIKIRMEKSYRR
jgi:hypothetical protein